MDLIEEAKQSDIAAVSKALEKDAYIDFQDIDRATALMYASTHGSTEIVKFLIEKGADVNIKSFIGSTALMRDMPQMIKRFGE